MGMVLPPSAVRHYRQNQRLQAAGVVLARRFWRRINPEMIRLSWGREALNLLPAVQALQVRAATAGAADNAMMMADQGFWEPPQRFVNPAAFGRYASDGRDMASLLRQPQIGALTLIKEGVPTQAALASGLGMLERIIATQIVDAGRAAASVDIAARTTVGYVRMLNPPSCSRCAILAGRFYRWNAGFLRHPRCDCVHIPSRESIAGDVTTDPYAYFNSLSAEEQDKAFTKAGAQAIRDGADIYQVENTRRQGARSKDNVTTTEGTSRQGLFGQRRRLTPDAIYAQAGSREQALEMLQANGYILPGGQVPGGSVRFPSLGGDTRRLTAAEQRLRTSRLRYEAVLDGRNPYDKTGKGLTPRIAAEVETDYRRWLTSGGQIYTQ